MAVENSPGLQPWGPVPRARPERASEVRRFSVPNAAFVEGNPVAPHDFTNLFLVAELFVMLGLVVDIGRNGFYVRLAYGEGAVSIAS